MSVLEIWGAEYQENDCLLIKPESRDLLQAVCDRERCFMQVGRVTRAKCGEYCVAMTILRTVEKCVLMCVWLGVEGQLGLGMVVIVIVCCACNDGTQKYMLDY
jgi:hypothetical protein